MTFGKVPSRESAQHDFKCPICGALASQGGCANTRECATSILRMEPRLSKEIATLAGDSRSRALVMAGFEALDLLNVGLVVVNASGRLLMSNQRADEMIAQRDGLEMQGNGVLRTVEGGGVVLGELIRQAAGAEGVPRTDVNRAVVAVDRPSGKRPFTLFVRSSGGRFAGQESGDSALLFILDPDLPMESTEAVLRQLYGLTSAEARMAHLLIEGKTLDECCEALDIQRTTARTHLQHLFEKVGVQRQSELVSLLLKTVGLVRPQSSALGAPNLASAAVRAPRAVQ